jgi:hypothetical protein
VKTPIYESRDINKYQFYTDDIVKYQEHIEMYYYTFSQAYLKSIYNVKLGQQNITTHFYDCLRAYNILKQFYVNKSQDDISIQISQFKNNNQLVLDTNTCYNVLQSSIAYQFLQLFNIDVTYDLPFTTNFKNFKKVIEEYISKNQIELYTRYVAIMKCKKDDIPKKSNKKYISSMLSFFNKLLEKIDIRINISTNYQHYDYSRVTIEYLNFKSQKKPIHHIPINYVVVKDDNTFTNEYLNDTPNYLKLTNEHITTPNMIVKFSPTNPNCVAEKINSFKVKIDNKDHKIYKINCGKKFKKTSDDLADICDALNDRINNSLNWLYTKNDPSITLEKPVNNTPTYTTYEPVMYEYQKSKRDKTIISKEDHHYFRTSPCKTIDLPESVKYPPKITDILTNHFKLTPTVCSDEFYNNLDFKIPLSINV